jgi:hypothetical protein
MSAAVAPAVTEPTAPLSGLPDLETLVKRSVKRTRAMFQQSDVTVVESSKAKLAAKLSDEYRDSQILPAAISNQQTSRSGPARPAAPNGPAAPKRKMIEGPQSATGAAIDEVASKQRCARRMCLEAVANECPA